jgi:C4-dicarboxylate-specific signal transduction histidine kinase
MVAGLVPTADSDRATPPQGYFLTINELDAEYLANLGDWTGARVTLLPPDAVEPSDWFLSPEEGTFVFLHPLTDDRGTRVGALRVERSSETLGVLAAQISQQRTLNRVIFTGLAALFAIIIYLLNRARARAESLAADMTRQLREANHTLEQRVTDRTASLEHEVEEHAKAETQLRARTGELEKMNKIMVDRELRMVELKGELEKEREEKPSP